MHIASINLRIDVLADGKNQWKFRKDGIIHFIKRESFDVIGMQEAGPQMFDDLVEGLGDQYKLIYQGRDHRGEGTPIAVKKGLLIESYGTKWLTGTPDIESTIANSHFPRIVTFVHIGGDTPFYFFNTHLDYASDNVCKIQTEHLLNITSLVNVHQLPYVITGDFNQYPDSKTIRFIRGKHQSMYDHVEKFPLTFHGFSKKTRGLPIDYIFFSEAWTLKSSKIHHHQKDLPYLSDHYPISAFLIKK